MPVKVKYKLKTYLWQASGLTREGEWFEIDGSVQAVGEGLLRRNIIWMIECDYDSVVMDITICQDNDAELGASETAALIFHTGPRPSYVGEGATLPPWAEEQTREKGRMSLMDTLFTEDHVENVITSAEYLEDHQQHSKMIDELSGG